MKREAASDSADVCTHSFKTIMEQHGIHHLLSDKNKVAIPSDNEKPVYLLFSANWSRPCKAFIPQLLQAYTTLKATNQQLEIIFVSFDRDETGFNEHITTIPWLVVPFNVNLQKTLGNVYKVNQIPSFIPLDLGKKWVAKDAVGMIKDYGADAFPFTRKRHDELKALDEAKRREGKLEELFADSDREFFLSGKGGKICTSELVGKTIGLYFGAHWCPPCRTFASHLTETYKTIIAENSNNFEVVFISTDRNSQEFELSVSKMPWLAIPYNNTRTRQDLCRIFQVKWIPSLIFLGPNGKPVSTNGRQMVSLYGANGFPFTEEKIMQIETGLIKEGDGLPRQLEDKKHEHVLKLDMAKAYICDFCKKREVFWAYSCHVCGYDLHPACINQNI